MKMWGDHYAKNPTDEVARRYHAAWCELRAAVDALVAIAPEPEEDISLAIAPR